MAMALMLQELNAANFSSGAADSGAVLTADGDGGTSWQDAAAGGGLSYAVYSALLTQTGTDAPVATVLENTLGGEIAWTREGAGIYTGTLVGGFDPTKTFLRCTNFVASKFAGVSLNGSNQIELDTYLPSDGDLGVYNPTDGIFLLSPVFIEIRVYGVSVGGSGGVPSVVGASDGDVLTVNSGVASWEAPAAGGTITCSLPSDWPLIEDTVLQSITGLSFALEGAKHYLCEFWIPWAISGEDIDGLAIAFSYTGTLAKAITSIHSLTNIGSIDFVVSGLGPVAFSSSAANDLLYLAHVICIVQTTTQGLLQFQAAMADGNGGGVYIFGGALGVARQV